jgi:hypothetical protein
LDATLIDNWVVGRPTSSSVLQARELINPPADRPAGLTRDGGRLHSCTGDPDRRERLHGHIPDAKYNLGLSIHPALRRRSRDMIRADWHAPRHEGDAARTCCVAKNPRGAPDALGRILARRWTIGTISSMQIHWQNQPADDLA